MGGQPTLPPPGPISFLSDYGLEDEFVGVVHRVLASLAPAVRVVDLLHNVPRHDITSAAHTLWRSAEWLAPGVVLAVVDPGVGTERRPVAVEVGARNVTFVAPDNGLILPAALRLGEITSAVELHTLVTGAGATFDGRDVFAPAAAQIANGVHPRCLGADIDAAGLRGTLLPRAMTEPDGRIACEILWIDHFGNAQLNASLEDLSGARCAVAVDRGSGGQLRMRVVHAYADLQPGEAGLVIDSYGMLAVSLCEEHAADRLGLRVGDPVWLAGEG